MSVPRLYLGVKSSGEVRRPTEQVEIVNYRTTVVTGDPGAGICQVGVGTKANPELETEGSFAYPLV